MSTQPVTPSSTKTPADETVKFLLACMKYTTNGKPDFAKVSEQMTADNPSKPLSKGAVAKRFERLLKQNGMPSLSEQARGTANAGMTKRKPSAADDDGAAEDEATPKKRKSSTTPKKSVSATPDEGGKAEAKKVKAETYSSDTV